MAIGNGARDEKFGQLDQVIAQWKDVPGGLLPIMQHAQEIMGCVDEQVQHYISDATGIPVSTIYGVATFYSQFTLKPRGKYTMGICLGTACYVRGIDSSGEYRVKDVSRTGINTWHDDAKGKKRGENIVFVFEFDMMRIVHLGDLGEVPDAETIELPEDAAQESTPDTDPADERRDDTNG